MPRMPSQQPPLEVDARGLRCPLPVLRLATALTGTPPDGSVLLLATDPAARSDVPAFCRMRGVELVEVTEHAADSGEHPTDTTYTTYLVRQVSSSTQATERSARD